jgi:crotonobetainyl-CoA:carnitine CoA-transferase CaiB-like acyl-CoA transferase
MLDDITVLDLTTFVTGGFATTMLANQGAEVIKIERPGVGDDNRHSGPPFVEADDGDTPGKTASERGESPYFWTVNYGKQSIELNLKNDDATEVFHELAAEADVVVENYRPGTAERLGVGYEDVREHNDQIVYCSISAFGDSGPWSDRPGYDLLVQGTGGIMSVTGEEDGDPVKVGLPQSDLVTAMWAAFGIVGALRRRDQTGEGERVELAMHDAVLPWLTKQAGKVFAGEQPGRMGTRDPVLAPYQTYPTADGYVNVACLNQKLWSQLCEAIERPELAYDDRFATNADRVENMDALEEELAEVFEQRTTDEWIELLAEEHGLPVGPVYEVDEALENEQTKARGAVGEMEHPAAGTIPVLEHPLNFDQAESGFDRPPPMLGEHTESLLRKAGYSEQQIEALEESGAIPEQ